MTLNFPRVDTGRFEPRTVVIGPHNMTYRRTVIYPDHPFSKRLDDVVDRGCEAPSASPKTNWPGLLSYEGRVETTVIDIVTMRSLSVPKRGAEVTSESRLVRLVFSLHISSRLSSFNFVMGKKSKSATAESSLSGFLLGQTASTEVQLDDSIFANSVRRSLLSLSRQTAADIACTSAEGSFYRFPAAQEGEEKQEGEEEQEPEGAEPRRRGSS